jgi:hypothetical protein
MGMIFQQRPSQYSRLGIQSNEPQSLDQILSILVIIHDTAFFNPSNDDMMQGTGSIQPGLSGHISSGTLDFQLSYHNNSIQSRTSPFLEVSFFRRGKSPRQKREDREADGGEVLDGRGNEDI